MIAMIFPVFAKAVMMFVEELELELFEEELLLPELFDDTCTDSMIAVD